MATLKQLIADGAEALADSDSARLDAELLLAVALNKPRTWLYTWPEHIPSLPEQHKYLDLLRRRQDGEPIAYLIHRREFYGLELKINHHVLIPRPETETLVECVLQAATGNAQMRIADLGTGSGAVALALAHTMPQARVVATDISREALTLARENAVALGIDNISFVQGSWLEPLADMTFDIIASNPPYIDAQDPHLSEGDVRFEPVPALVSPENGLADIRQIAETGMPNLAKGGRLFFEHGYAQGEAVRAIFSAYGYGDISTVQDLSGQDRVTMGRK
ncbi:MAG: peptide chain release factor N(5)-glutamine methyltransferase [Pseudohongiellaceae bacterium]|jgi:release factor glutamine methyltransferase